MNRKVVLSIFLSILFVICFSVFFAAWQGKRQDEVYRQDYEKLLYAHQLLEQQRGEEAVRILKKLYKQYPDRYNIMRDLGLAYALAGNFSKASFYYDKALKQRPFLQADPLFMVQFGEILYFNREYAKAKVILEKAKQLAGSDKYHQRIDELLASIQSQSN